MFVFSFLFAFLFVAVKSIQIDFGSIRRLHVNVGPNITPIMPDERDDHMAVLAVEANVQLLNMMPKHPRLHVMFCAIGAQAGFAQFNTYNTDGVSRSLSKTANNDTEGFVPTNLAQRFTIVPVLTLSNLLEAIPTHVEIQLLKTDMQGHDYAALASAGAMLRRVNRIMSQCYAPGTATYAGVHNECDRDIDVLLTRLGFRRTSKTAAFTNEFDVEYERLSADSPIKHVWHHTEDNIVAPVWLPVVRSTPQAATFSQCGQDFIIRKLFPEGSFFYVDLAANDPIYISNCWTKVDGMDFALRRIRNTGMVLHHRERAQSSEQQWQKRITS
jgi:FkbM family methyltransferase